MERWKALMCKQWRPLSLAVLMCKQWRPPRFPCNMNTTCRVRTAATELVLSFLRCDRLQAQRKLGRERLRMTRPLLLVFQTLLTFLSLNPLVMWQWRLRKRRRRLLKLMAFFRQRIHAQGFRCRLQPQSCRRYQSNKECFTLNQKCRRDLVVTGRSMVSETNHLRLRPIYTRYFLLMLLGLIKMQFTAD